MKKRVYRALVDVDWQAGGKKVVLTPGDPPAEVPAKFAAWLLECGAIVDAEEVSGDGDR